MTLLEAYEFTLGKVRELEKDGVDLVVSPCPSRKDKEVIKKFPDGLPPEKWVHVSFAVDDDASATKVHEAVNYIGMCGITFDTGGHKGLRDWELDWSFRYTGEEDWERRDARDSVEDEIRKMGDDSPPPKT